MLKAWIFGFACGVVVARCPFAAPWWRPSVPEAAWIALLILALPVARWSMRWPGHMSGVVTVIGIFWGIAHAAPPPERPWSNAQVVTRSTRFAERGPLLLRTTQGFHVAEGLQSAGGQAWLWPARSSRSAWFGLPSASAVVRGSAQIPPLVRDARAYVDAKLAPLPAAERGFLAAILLGDKRQLQPTWQQAFFVTGLMHLLVVSGLHVSLVAQALTLAIAFPAQLLYALRWLSPRQWHQTQAILRLIAAAGAVGYAALVGMNAASHRAAFVYALLQITSIFCGRTHLAGRLLLVFALQILVYPLGLFSDATAMSWFAYLVVLAVVPDEVDWWRRCRQTVIMQGQLIVGSGAFFGNLPLLGFLANPIFVPLFPLLLACGFGATTGVGVVFDLACVRTYADWVMVIASLGQHFPACPTLPAIGLGLCRGWTVCVWLNTCRRLSIRHYED